MKKFERVLHFLRVTVTGNRIEVTAVRADGTTVETTSWTEGAALPGPIRQVAEGRRPRPPSSRRHGGAAAPTRLRRAPLLWFVIGGALLLGAVGWCWCDPAMTRR